MERRGLLDGTRSTNPSYASWLNAEPRSGSTSKLALSALVLFLMVVPLLTVSAWSGPAALPSHFRTMGPQISPMASRGANGSANNSSSYCPGGHSASVGNSSDSLEACYWVFSSSPYYAVSMYANATNGSAGYRFVFQFGDGYGWNTSGLSNLSGTVTHYYPATGNYTINASVSDAFGRLTAALPIAVTVVNSSRLSVALSYTETTAGNGSTVSALGYTVQGGLPFTNTGATPTFGVQLNFGDGTGIGGRYNLSGSPGGWLHQYGPVANRTTYPVSVMVWDEQGSTAGSTLNVSPTYNFATNTSGNNSTQGSRTTVLLSTANFTEVYLLAWNGSFQVSAIARLTAGINSSFLSLANGTVSGGRSPVQVDVHFGDGGAWNATFFLNGTNGTVQTNHTYFHSGTTNLTLRATDNYGQYIQAIAALPVHFLNGTTGGSGGGNSSAGSNFTVITTGPNGTRVVLRAWNGSFQFFAIGVVIPLNGSALFLLQNATLSGPSTTVRASIQYGDGTLWNATYIIVGMNPTAFGANHTYRHTAVYRFVFNATDSNGTSLSVAGPLNVTFASSRGNGSAPHPASVTVTVGAAPVTGSAPLNTTLSAYLFGGSAPFVVDWSLPGSNWTTNATGLMVAVTYTAPGWYPATAFVYNTTNAYGTVLVGEGGVWIYASGSTGSGNGSHGNGSPNGSGATPIGGGKVPAGGASAEMISLGLLAAVVAGAALGGLGGFLAGRRSVPARRVSAPGALAQLEDPVRTR